MSAWWRPRAWLVALVRVYQRVISPLTPPACRFTPTCSQYAAEAFGRHGVILGTALTVWRILRCNPLCRGGYDPVPERIRWPGRRAEKGPDSPDSTEGGNL